ncbi:MAG: hypothetical protein K9L83_07620, partial [Deltaproteobacteria bacterium]|nr:hypothetical protein [Deltaproteobacteria bacterium]
FNCGFAAVSRVALGALWVLNRSDGSPVHVFNVSGKQKKPREHLRDSPETPSWLIPCFSEFSVMINVQFRIAHFSFAVNDKELSLNLSRIFLRPVFG